jgi:hypothetical protein
VTRGVGGGDIGGAAPTEAAAAGAGGETSLAGMRLYPDLNPVTAPSQACDAPAARYFYRWELCTRRHSDRYSLTNLIVAKKAPLRVRHVSRGRGAQFSCATLAI